MSAEMQRAVGKKGLARHAILSPATFNSISPYLGSGAKMVTLKTMFLYNVLIRQIKQ